MSFMMIVIVSFIAGMITGGGALYLLLNLAEEGIENIKAEKH